MHDGVDHQLDPLCCGEVAQHEQISHDVFGRLRTPQCSQTADPQRVQAHHEDVEISQEARPLRFVEEAVQQAPVRIQDDRVVVQIPRRAGQGRKVFADRRFAAGEVDTRGARSHHAQKVDRLARVELSACVEIRILRAAVVVAILAIKVARTQSGPDEVEREQVLPPSAGASPILSVVAKRSAVAARLTLRFPQA